MPKSRSLGTPLRSDQYVAGLYVAVNDQPLMSILNSGAYLREKRQPFGRSKAFGNRNIAQWAGPQSAP